jgi:hypothetical protein
MDVAVMVTHYFVAHPIPPSIIIIIINSTASVTVDDNLILWSMNLSK